MKRFKLKGKIVFIMTIMLSFESSFYAVSYASEGSDELKVQDVNYSKEFEEYCNDLKDGDVSKYDGLIPNIYDVELTKSGALESFDSKYDPRELNLTTSVKNQGINEVCWAFAGMGTLEAYFKLKGLGTFDFSEEHARWYNTLDENGYGWNRTVSEGGPTQIVPGYFTSGAGPKLEKDIPYSYSNINRPSNMDSVKTVVDVTDIEYVANDTNSVKRAIKENGAVESCYYDNSSYYSGNSYYYNGSSDTTVNHAITIVGWDDNYSKENFKNAYKPENNGAWLIKNSWGQNKYDGGYMWISYEDKILLNGKNGNLNYSIKSAQLADDNDKKKYEWDKYGAITKCGFTLNNKKVDEAYYMNIFDFTNDYDILDSVMFMSESIGATYSVYYDILDEQGIPNTDVNKMKLLATGTIDYSGYKTVKVNNYPLKSGKGAIVVKVSDPGNANGISIGCETKVTYVNNNKVAYYPEANEGESFIMVNNDKSNNIIIEDMNGNNMKSASNYTPKNFSIKAITVKGNHDYTTLQLPQDYEKYVSYLEDLEKNGSSEYEEKLAFMLKKYNSLDYEDITEISQDIRNKIETLSVKLADKNHKSGDIVSYNLPWNIKIQSEIIDAQSNEWKTFEDKITNKKILQVYKINAYDILDKKAYIENIDIGINNTYNKKLYTFVLKNNDLIEKESSIEGSNINLNISDDSYIALAEDASTTPGSSTVTFDKNQVIFTMMLFILSIFTIYSLTKNKKVI